jgi:hypothetical protein
MPRCEHDVFRFTFNRHADGTKRYGLQCVVCWRLDTDSFLGEKRALENYERRLDDAEDCRDERWQNAIDLRYKLRGKR